MRTQSYTRRTPDRLTAKAASINEFFEDHMSRSELILDEIEESLLVKKEQYPQEDEGEDPEEWIHSLYERGLRSPL